MAFDSKLVSFLWLCRLFRYIFRKPHRRDNVARFTSEIGISAARQVLVYVKSGQASRLTIFLCIYLEILDKT